MNGDLRTFDIEREDLSNPDDSFVFPIRVVKYADHLDLMDRILKAEVRRRESLVDVVREQLLQEFLNGNLKHTFKKKLVDDEKFVNTFIDNLREALLRRK